MRTFWIVIVLALWILLGYFMCSASRDCCRGTEGVSKNINEAPAALKETVEKTFVKESGPLLFNWESFEPIANQDWATRKEAILSKLDDKKKLKITGRYFKDEINNSEYADLGLARAHGIKDKLFPELSDDRIEYLSRISADREGIKTNAFRSVDFDYAIYTETVKEIDGKANVMFPFNATRRIRDPNIEQYLNDLVERLQTTQENVKITGHTCNIGNTPSNETLGMWRAEVIRDYLIAKGVQTNRISITTMGERSPRVPNTNEANRKQNRRAEIELIK